ncbi:MAG: peptide chain release factor N(5)-glutamine methyltransferase [Chitinophagaceae bacterium]|nr:peptide chain release factor N(5)-glutamine methyltransferase [Chitinophagaceae bacterium]MBK8951592.1 peptide chain release factor N(5)-glutamine methyltransferase [Chitinophagaceae bacterium]
MTIKEAGRKCLDGLLGLYPKGEAEAITEIVLEYISKKKRNEIWLFATTQLSQNDELLFDSVLERLRHFEPVQYIINEAWFYAMPFYVDKHVLIPRPETEELVHWIIADRAKKEESPKILDIGSGSGCIPISLKKKLPFAEVWSCDISKEALKIAKRNATANQTEVNFLELDILDHKAWDKLPVFDIIVSNPPYVPESDKKKMQPNVLNFEPHLALFVSDRNPLTFYKAIADFALIHLSPNGCVYLEIHEYLGKEVTTLLMKQGFIIEVKQDMQQKDRMLRCEKKGV